MASVLMSVGQVVGALAQGGKPGGAGPRTLMDVFAAVLASVRGGSATSAQSDTSETAITQSSTATMTLNGISLGDAVSALAGRLRGSETSGEGEGLEALLAKLEDALAAGAETDPDLLAGLGAIIDAMATLTGGVDAALGGTADAAGEGLAAAAAKPAGPGGPNPSALLERLTQRLAALADKLAETSPKAAETLAGLAEKLAAVRTASAELGASVPELRAVLHAMVQGKVEVGGNSGPAFAAPALDVPAESGLTGKASDTQGPAARAMAQAAAEGAAAPKPQSLADLAIKADAAPPSQAGAMPADAGLPAPGVAPGSVQVAENGVLRAVHTAYQAPSPINLPQVAFEIARHVQQGVSRFQIRLDPPELGRIDIKLDMDQGGQVNARLTVERAETLDLLQRDQRALERALAQAGLDAGKTNLEFSLKQNPFAQPDGGGPRQGGSPFGGDASPVQQADAEPAPSVIVYRGSATKGGVNIFV